MVNAINYSDAFIDTLYTLSHQEITPELQAEARRCLLDGLGSLYGGLELMRGRVDAYLDQLPEVPGGATVIGHGRRASMQDAALSNARMRPSRKPIPVQMGSPSYAARSRYVPR